mmetsp:Transcript_51925/g.62426  ORF Transcript_51925/g.62426 Transcript_51925/m.62426 type:complete len:367 (+) Transcript_51925:40-1140(+)
MTMVKSLVNPPEHLNSVAIFGLSLTFSLWLITSWRLFFHYFGCPCSPTSQEISRVPGLTMRRSFHSLLWISTLFEGIAYIEGTISNNSEIVAYILLRFGLTVFQYGAFSVVTVYWIQQCQTARAGAHETKKIFVILVGILVSTSVLLFAFAVWDVVDLLLYYDNIDDFVANSMLHFIMAPIVCVTWNILGINNLVCVYLIVIRLVKVPSWKNLGRMQKFRLVMHKISGMIICAICYMVRGIYVIIHLAGISYETDWMYWMGAVWIPTVVPSIILLYAFRRRDRLPGWIEGGHVVDLVAPPTEAFSALSNYLTDADHLSVSEATPTPRPSLEVDNNRSKSNGLYFYDFSQSDSRSGRLSGTYPAELI